jgi:PHD/YefM family antitoxin component YafN of YafNO toxin-antitoxin module
MTLGQQGNPLLLPPPKPRPQAQYVFTYANGAAMTSVTATEARKRGNAVLLSEGDWRSILEGMTTDVSELSSEPGW